MPMYVALKQLVARDLTKIQPGQIVEEASTWRYPVLKAHLDNEWIKQVPDEEQPKKAQRPRRKK